jgi:hypothetical protein
LERIGGDNQHGRRSRDLWTTLNNVVKQSGHVCLDDYESRFEPNEHGYDVRGEEWSLGAYQRVWEQLVEEQRARNEQKQDGIVVRVTHSNDIAIWGIKAEQLLGLQKDFIDYGGVIVRLLMYQGEEASEAYLNVQERMKAKGIEARLCRLLPTDDVNFDFLWACANEKTAELQCVVKWYPGAGGLRLAGCKITDLVDDEVRRFWRLFAHRSEEAEGKFKNIPDSRRTV